jgi:ring-1,2-phenylacetyl-CoA epoxidase subunit PaaC
MHRTLDYVLRIADNTLILGQRLSEWCGHGPVLEEDIALTNIALDLIGQARMLLTPCGQVEGRGATRTSSPFCATSTLTATSRCRTAERDFAAP